MSTLFFVCLLIFWTKVHIWTLFPAGKQQLYVVLQQYLNEASIKPIFLLTEHSETTNMLHKGTLIRAWQNICNVSGF